MEWVADWPLSEAVRPASIWGEFGTTQPAATKTFPIKVIQGVANRGMCGRLRRR
jgi:hypothetical protein